MTGLVCSGSKRESKFNCVSPQLSSPFATASMISGEIYQHPTIPAENRLATIYSLPTIASSSRSSGASCSNYAGNRSAGFCDSSNTIPPQDVIDTLNLLEEVDQEVSHEVARIQDKIKEARLMMEEYQREKRARMKVNTTLVVGKEQKTRRADDGLWLAA